MRCVMRCAITGLNYPTYLQVICGFLWSSFGSSFCGYLDEIKGEEFLPVDDLGDDGIRTCDLAVTGRNLYLCAN